MHASFGGSDVYEGEQSTAQLIIDQVEELIVTLIEEIRERPAVAAAILAAVLGALIGGMLAAGVGRPKPVRKRIERRMGDFGDVTSLVRLGYQLLENPIVRGYVTTAVLKQFRKRF
jgi:hypothetical protein